MKLLLVIIFSLLLLIGDNLYGQTAIDMKFAKTLFVPKAKANYKGLVKENKNEIEKTFSVMFMAYKNFVSSQDIDACIFEPSCSVYAIECIHHEKNKVIAYLKISDRLMRCNPLVTQGAYKINPKTGKYIDPFEN